jgi:hypothetical protein
MILAEMVWMLLTLLHGVRGGRGKGLIVERKHQLDASFPDKKLSRSGNCTF